jgi:hypothetical protein
MEDKGQERMELGHEAVPGYKKIFYIVFGLGIAWLAAVFLFWVKH